MNRFTVEFDELTIEKQEKQTNDKGDK